MRSKLTYATAQVPGRQDFDGQIRIHLSDDLDAISIGEMGFLS